MESPITDLRASTNICCVKSTSAQQGVGTELTPGEHGKGGNEKM